MKKILYALTGVSMLALTTQVSAVTVKSHATWTDSGGGYNDQQDTRTFDVDGNQVGADTYKDDRTWTHQDHGSNTRTGEIPDGPYVGGPGTYPMGGEVVLAED